MMKRADLPEAYRMLQAVEHCKQALELLGGNETPIQIKLGSITVTIGTEDPDRLMVAGPINEYLQRLQHQAESKLSSYNLEADRKVSEITGFPEDDNYPLTD